MGSSEPNSPRAAYVFDVDEEGRPIKGTRRSASKKDEEGPSPIQSKYEKELKSDSVTDKKLVLMPGASVDSEATEKALKREELAGSPFLASTTLPLSTNGTYRTGDQRLGDFFENRPSGRNFSDLDFQQISSALQACNRQTWSLVPRIYSVLRIIGQLQVVDNFIDEGITDVWFPFTTNKLPKALSSSMQAQFLDTQQVVYTKALGLESDGAKLHAHFGRNEALPFRVEETLGEGAHGKVQRIVSLISGRAFARKEFRRGNTRAIKKEIESFLRELQILKRLHHHHCVELVASYTDPRHFGLIMSPIAESNMLEFYNIALSDPSKKPILRQSFGCLAAGLAYLHEERVRHRDIKPQNILVKGDHVYLADFGVSLDWISLSRSTTVEDSAKTWIYCAPEVAAYEPRNTSSDIWSLGCVYLEMVTVLKGFSLEDMRQHFKKTSENYWFWNNHASTETWTAKLRERGLDWDSMPLEWVVSMLKTTATERPTAARIAETIGTFNFLNRDSPVSFCGDCCELLEDSERSVSDDDEWNQQMANLTLNGNSSEAEEILEQKPASISQPMDSSTTKAHSDQHHNLTGGVDAATKLVPPVISGRQRLEAVVSGLVDSQRKDPDVRSKRQIHELQKLKLRNNLHAAFGGGARVHLVDSSRTEVENEYYTRSKFRSGSKLKGPDRQEGGGLSADLAVLATAALGALAGKKLLGNREKSRQLSPRRPTIKSSSSYSKYEEGSPRYYENDQSLGTGTKQDGDRKKEIRFAEASPKPNDLPRKIGPSVPLRARDFEGTRPKKDKTFDSDTSESDTPRVRHSSPSPPRRVPKPARFIVNEQGRTIREETREIRIVSPSREPVEEKPTKGILRKPREKFPEEPSPVREGVAPLKDAHLDSIPPDARWTKISRKLVNPEALEAGKERFEAREDFVIVLRVLSREEVQGYVEVTEKIRAAREEAEKVAEEVEKAARRRARRERHEREKLERQKLGPVSPVDSTFYGPYE